MVKPSDIAHLITLGPPTVAPDGRTAVVATARPDLDNDDYRGELWTVALDGQRAATPADPRRPGPRATLLTGRQVGRVPPGRPEGQAAAVRATDRRRGRARSDRAAGRRGHTPWSPDSARSRSPPGYRLRDGTGRTRRSPRTRSRPAASPDCSTAATPSATSSTVRNRSSSSARCDGDGGATAADRPATSTSGQVAWCPGRVPAGIRLRTARES